MGIVRSKKYPIIDGRPAIEIKVETLSQLFDERDPAPFLNKDLDEDAEEYIISSIQEIGMKDKLILAIFSEDQLNIDTNIIENAIHKHFSYKADLIATQIKAKLKLGFKALIIGLSFLFIATLSSVMIPDKNLVLKFFKEGLMLLGWVSMWFPVNIFLYEWWPLADKRRMMVFLSKVDIKIHLHKKYLANNISRLA